MQRRLAFVDPFFCELYSFEPRVKWGFEGPTKATQSFDSPEPITFPTDYNTKLPASAATGRQIDYMNVMSLMLEFHCQPRYWILTFLDPLHIANLLVCQAIIDIHKI